MINMIEMTINAKLFNEKTISLYIYMYISFNNYNQIDIEIIFNID